MLSEGMKKFYLYLVIFAIIFLFLFIPIVVPYLSRSADYSVFNNDWNGTSNFYKGYLEKTELYSLHINEDIYLNTIIGSLANVNIDDPSKTIILMLGPSASFSDAEKKSLSSFLNESGTLIIADDFGTSNEILDHLGSDYKFSGKIMLDLIYEKAGVFPIVYCNDEVIEHTLLLNYPTSITGNAETLFSSSSSSFLDNNENLAYDLGETKGPFTIATKFEIEGGTIYLLSDPSIFINNMFGHLDNEEFVFKIMEELTGNYQKKLYIDEGHLSTNQDLRHINIIIKAPHFDLFRYLVIGFLTLVIVWEFRILSIIPKHMSSFLARLLPASKDETIKLGREQLISELKQRHPEWGTSSLNAFFSKFKEK